MMKRYALVVVMLVGCGPVVDASADATSGDATTGGVSSTSTGPTSADVTTATPLPDVGDGPFECSS